MTRLFLNYYILHYIPDIKQQNRWEQSLSENNSDKKIDFYNKNKKDPKRTNLSLPEGVITHTGFSVVLSCSLIK